MDELRRAVLAVAEEAHIIERQMVACEDPPSKPQRSANGDGCLVEEKEEV
jgi:hypothetical protein